LKSNLLAYLAGLLFGFGLILAGMTDTSKVIGFLDFFGAWDPSLAFVMVGAIGVHALLFRLIVKRPAPLVDSHFHVPTRRELDLRLVGGAAIFGVGWGLAGFCPGPGIVSLGTGTVAALVFVAAMALGMGVEGRLARLSWQKSEAVDEDLVAT